MFMVTKLFDIGMVALNDFDAGKYACWNRTATKETQYIHCLDLSNTIFVHVCVCEEVNI